MSLTMLLCAPHYVLIFSLYHLFLEDGYITLFSNLFNYYCITAYSIYFILFVFYCSTCVVCVSWAYSLLLNVNK